MARALECPACGARHRVDNLPADATTFRCDRCGQVLKVPSAVSSTTGGPPPPARAGGPSAGPAAVAPPPRRRPDDTPIATAAATASAAAVSATVPAVASAYGGGPTSRRDRGRGTGASAAPKRVAWYWRLVAWIVAVPIGFVLTAWPAYQLGLIKKADVLDIFVGTGSGRYVRLAIGTAIWALVTALLVQLLVEGGRRWAARRRARVAVA